MIYTHTIQRAITLAINTHQVHQHQVRKGKNTPYITHPLTVALILARAGADEDTIVAGILHDTVEDSTQTHKVTIEQLAKEFGANVAALVESVTEPDKSLSWENRKAAALAKVTTFSHPSVLIKSADLVSNITEIVQDHEEMGDDLFDRFNAPRDKLVSHYQHLSAALIFRWPDSPLAEDVRRAAHQLQEMEILRLMAAHPALTIEYRDYTKRMPLTCSVCDWEGTAASSNVEHHDDCLDASCPVCGKMLLVVSYPLIK